MIEKMKKLTFLVTTTEYDSFLSELRKMGVVHVQELGSGTADDTFRTGMETADRYKAALTALDFARESYTTAAVYEPRKGMDRLSADEAMQCGLDLLDEIEAELANENTLKHKLDATRKNLRMLEPWGDFDRAGVERLAHVGCGMHFFACGNKMFRQEWVDEYFATPISEVAKKVYFVAFADHVPDISAEHIELPAESLSHYQQEEIALTDALTQSHEHLLRINGESRDLLLMGQTENENRISLSKVRFSSESLAGDALRLMVGWVLADKASEVTGAMDRAKVFYEMEDPAFEDDVPVKIKNDAYSRLFEPILRMYSLPNYHDLDPTPVMAPFFMLFFGLCMGDAGYGLLILAASLMARRKLGGDLKGFATLGVFLGAMTMVCGLLTGSVLGIDLTQQDWTFLAPLKPYFVNEANYTLFGYSPMMVISVFIGLFQVLVGMCMSAVKATRLYGWKYGVGKFSWVVALVSAILCFGLPACGVMLPVALTYVFYALITVSALGIYFYNSPDKNVFVNFGSGLWSTYNMATGLLGDLLSYIRLFALGLTGGVLGGVFNELAFEMTSSMPWLIRWLPMLIILLMGHGINFALCMISSFVHPMRLTFVEFFKNADFEGGGKEYSPFRIKTYKKQSN
ncbi:MAG: hypothetical protein NC388_06735 [Clostridium sp.]|nr:hypothetical protein [Clostridium sp.]